MTEGAKREFREVYPGNYEEQLRQFGIHLGVPLVGGTIINNEGNLDIPTEPHVFFCQELNLFNEGQNPITLNNVMVMHGHGLVLSRDLDNWVWRGTRKPVHQTIKTYETVARALNWAQVDVILACRDESWLSADPTEKIKVLFSRSVDLPYIFAMSDVLQMNSSVWDRRKYHLREGVKALDALTRKWHNVELWQRTREAAQRGRNIPTWAKMPASPYRIF